MLPPVFSQVEVYDGMPTRLWGVLSKGMLSPRDVLFASASIPVVFPIEDHFYAVLSVCCFPMDVSILNRKTKTMRISLSYKSSVSNFFSLPIAQAWTVKLSLELCLPVEFFFSRSHFTLKCISLKVPILLVFSVPVLHLCFSPWLITCLILAA